MDQNIGKGMLSNLLQYPCPTTSRSAPNFDQIPKQMTLNEYLYKMLEDLNNEDINISNVASEMENLVNLPDGAFLIKKADKEGLTYRIQINDGKYL